MDASLHLWFGDKKCQLHAAVDDATGNIVGAHFDHQETLKGYYIVLKQIIENMAFLGNFILITELFSTITPQNANHDKPTNFKFACRRLGIDIITTSVPQARSH